MRDNCKCSRIDEILEDSGRGVRVLNIYNLYKRGSNAKQLITLFSGEHRKKGIIMNFCPFCGKHFKEHAWLRKREKVKFKKDPQ